MNGIKISVIIPVYNQEKYLAACIDSVLEQTLQGIEIICIDDGSSDRSGEVLLEYAKKDLHVRILHQENGGAGAARNEGIKIAQGEFIAFMDSDDYYYRTDVLEKLYVLAKKNHVDICGGKLAREKEGNLIWEENPLWPNPVSNAINLYEDYQSIYGFTTFLYKRELLIQNNICFPTYKRHEDPPFLLRAMHVSGKFYYSDLTVYVARKYDKIVYIQDKNIVQDFIRSFDDMLKYSMEQGLSLVHGRLICELDRCYGILFIKSLMNRDDNTDNLLNAMIAHVNLQLLEEGERKKFLNFKTCVHNPDNIFVKISGWRSDLRDVLRAYDRIIIYGAGIAGKYLCSLIRNMNYRGNIYMCVSGRNIGGTACGIAIHCIEDYVDIKESAMVLVAGRGGKTSDMKANAERLGYKRIQVMEYEKIYAML